MRLHASVLVFTGFALMLGASRANAQPAPALSQLRAEVSSSGYTLWDPVPVGGISTPHDHKGPTLIVRVFETGYASSSSRIAQFNGTRMTLIRSDPQVNASRQVTGCINYYRYDGSWTSGTFTYQATSLVYPYRTLSLRIYVR